MIDLSGLKSPAWQRVIAELTAQAPDDKAFLMRMVGVLGHVSGARQAVLYAMPRSAEAVEGEDAAGAAPRPLLVWPPQNMQPGASAPEDPAGQVTHPGDMASAARRAIESGLPQAFGFDRDEMFYDGGAGSGGNIIATPVSVGQSASRPGEPASPMVYAVSMLVEGRSKPALQTTLAIVELVAGYAHGHRTGQQLKRLRVSSAALDLAARLIAAINAATSFKGAVLQLANDLVRQLQAERVSIGWARGVGRRGEGQTVHAIAISDTEHIDRRMAMIQKLEGAMNECFDQEQPVLFPPAPESGAGADVVLATAITHAHREMAAGNASARVFSIPLRVEERVIGVVTAEFGASSTGQASTGVDPQMIEIVQAVLDLVAPVLRIRRSDDRILPLRAWDDALKAGAWLVGPTHTVWKLVGVFAVALALVLTLVKVPYRVEAPAELRPRERRVVSAPFDGIVWSLSPGIEPGSRVEAGQVLATMDTSELRLQAINATGEIIRAEKEADSALASGKLADAQQSRAKAQQARAELDLLQSRIERAELKAPIGGTIIAGDLRERVGASVKLGDPLFQIAPLEDMLVVAKVGDRDISLVEAGGSGSVATRAYPAQRHAFTVERIVPLSEAEEGKNAFEVRAKLASPTGWMRPGMEGFAKFDAGEHSLIWIGTRRIRDTLRIWLWW